ncbi:AI-2E family transporter [Pseudonocardia xinjiangensis]|uniref:AI-2E family transporter n=1 Tax=Pseudonocardia xinjiangensis TaxID=75289 RepID=A0ABX1RL03_9PSEU|nr:AI-2E family transporter [Pseudonocardia xinjiangensis]NMH81033.1 AI-2E family transporter [Pseudonocardia xinjiangensis]
MTDTARSHGVAASEGPGTRPALPRGLIVLLGLAAAVVTAAGVRAMAWLVGPVFLALVLVIAVAPVRDRLTRRGLPGWLSTLVLVLAVYAVLLVMSGVVVVSVARLATVVPQYADQAQRLVTSATDTLQQFGVGPAQLRAAEDSLDWGNVAVLLGSVLEGVAGLAANLVLLLALVLFLTVDASGIGARLAAIGGDRPQIVTALHGFAANTRTYLVVTTVFGLVVAVLDSVALLLLGVPLAITWGVLSFITNFIPNIGFVLGLVPPAVLGLLEGGWGTAVAVIVVYGVLNFVIQSLIQPRFIGNSVGLSVTVSFVSLVFWAWLIGPLGAVLAIPLTLLAKALLVDVDPRAGWADALLRDHPERLSPDDDGRRAGGPARPADEAGAEGGTAAGGTPT